MPSVLNISVNQLQKCLPSCKRINEVFDSLSRILPKYGITTERRLAAFLAQCGHESQDFSLLMENLNYSAQGLVKVFPSRFPTINAAQPYHRQPEKIANKIYASRMGNGAETSGDGWQYRGRGAIQLTGKNNYQLFATSIGRRLDDTVAYCETLDGAIESACWFWNRNNLNSLADNGDIKTMTKKINGGYIGLEDREDRYENIIEIINQ